MFALDIKNLKKSYKGVYAVKGLTLQVKEGEFLAFLGPNGAGKTTTIGCVTGLVTYHNGSIKVFSNDVIQDYRVSRSLVGLSPQEPVFDRTLNVQDILVYQAGYMGIRKNIALKRAEELLKLFDLWEKRKEDWMKLSGGMKRRLSIAKAMMHNPKLLILDEPTAGLDAELRRDLWDYIKKVNKGGVTIILTTHYIEEAQQLADRIAIVNNGKLIKLDDKNNLLDLGMRQLVVECDPIPKVDSDIKKLITEQKGNKIVFTYKKNQQYTDKILKILSNPKIKVHNITTQDESLEEIFLKLTGGKK